MILAKKTYSVRLAEGDRAAIEEIARLKRVKSSHVVRWAVEHYVTQYHEGKLDGLLPFADGSHLNELPPGPGVFDLAESKHMVDAPTHAPIKVRRKKRSN